MQARAELAEKGSGSVHGVSESGRVSVSLQAKRDSMTPGWEQENTYTRATPRIPMRPELVKPFTEGPGHPVCSPEALTSVAGPSRRILTMLKVQASKGGNSFLGNLGATRIK